MSKKPNEKMDLNEEESRPLSQTDLVLNILGTLAGIGEALEAIAVELSDLKENDNIRLMEEGLISQDEIEKREEDSSKENPNDDKKD